ncbi:MAG: hypothetical protein KDD36_01550 [Flavobacteriales bacterium]|nr:hypothetical protein [Flavobacteriales bacterium]
MWGSLPVMWLPGRVFTAYFSLIGFLFAGCVLLVSCGSGDTVTKQELQEYLRDAEHGLTKQREVGNARISLTYRPVDLLVERDLRDRERITQEAIDSARAPYSDFHYFILSMSVNNKEVAHASLSDRTVFTQMIERLSFDMGRFVYIISDHKDTVHLADFIYPRMYGMTGGTEMLLAFPKASLQKSRRFEFVLEDIGLQIGTTRFSFETDDLGRVPVWDWS